MNSPDLSPDHPTSAQAIPQEGDWILVIRRRFQHSSERVWSAITDPDELSRWAPFDASAPLGSKGAQAVLTTVGAAHAEPSETLVTECEPGRLLVYRWGDHDLRWELEEDEAGVLVTLKSRIPASFIAMGAAGWHVCLDVLESGLYGSPRPRLTSRDALADEGWQALHRMYSEKFGVEAPKW